MIAFARTASPALAALTAGTAALAALVALVAMPAAADAAGTGGVEGTVVDQVDSQVVPGGRIAVAITCGSVHKIGSVDRTGHFAIADLPEGACTLTAHGAAYATTTIGLTVTGGSIATVLVGVTTRAFLEQQRKVEAEQRKYLRRMAPRAAGAGRGDRVQFDVPVPEAMPAPMPPPPAVAAAPPREPARPPAKTPVAKAQPQAQPARPPVGDAIAAQRPGALADPVARAKKVRIPDGKDRAAFGNKRGFGGLVGDNRVLEQQQAAGEWALVRVFPVPAYTRGYDGPRSDFRETVYWNPSVQTSASGDAEVAFTVSDAVTSFRATAEGFSAGGLPGGGSVAFASRLPLALDARLPVEVTAGDTIKLPITLTNETDEPIDAALDARFGTAFRISGAPPPRSIRLAAHDKQSLLVPLDVVATDGGAEVAIKLIGRGLSDELIRTIRVVPRGFPIEISASGTARQGTARHAFDLAGALPGSIRATVTMMPSPIAAMTEGMAGMIREPGGCFEQTSSTNYPNIMILGYLGASNAADPALIAKTQGVLDHGYKLLTGYETPGRGYEWFGHTPGHEALTAYGLMEFADMAKVYDVDPKMVERTAEWLMNRRDGRGGFQRSAQALDSFGRANPTTTNAYIVWALAEARRTGALDAELAVQRTLGGETRDPYLLALAANTALIAQPRASETAAMVGKLVAMQARDGSFPGAAESITMSGGESLAIETTALAMLALIKASPEREREAQIRAGVDWLNGKRGGYGAWGNTQATILGLKALTAYADYARQVAAPGAATLIVNGVDAGTIQFDKGRRDALSWSDLSGKLTAGANTIEVRLDGRARAGSIDSGPQRSKDRNLLAARAPLAGAQLPYTIAIEYRSARPQSSPRTKLAVSTELAKTQARMGDAVTLRAHVVNTTASGIPMTLARIGIPGGLVFQTWQLKELRDKGAIDFYETRPREVIVYWRALPPSAQRDVELQLLAAVPGRYEAPASSAYLYYTAEDKAWSAPVAVAVDR